MRNTFLLGFQKDIFAFLPNGRFLLLHDEVPELPDTRRAVVFDPLEASFNPFNAPDYHYATLILDAFAAAFPAGENTLTKETGLDFLLQALLHKPKALDALIAQPDGKSSTGHIWAYHKVQRILASPVLKRVFDPAANQFKFENRVVLARLNRKTLTDFDALFLGLLLIGHVRCPIVIPDFGFYGRDVHVRLLRDNRLIAGLNSLDEVPAKLRSALLSIPDKEPHGALYDDAVVLAKYAKDAAGNPLIADTNAFNDFVFAAMQG